MKLYMRRLRGKFRYSNSATKFRTELRELRSRAITMISASGTSDRIRVFVSSAAFTLRAGKISLTPRFARTLAVSAPIPDVAPAYVTCSDQKWGKISFNQFFSMKILTSDNSGDRPKIRRLFGDVLGSGFWTVTASSGGTKQVLHRFKHFFG